MKSIVPKTKNLIAALVVMIWPVQALTQDIASAIESALQADPAPNSITGTPNSLDASTLVPRFYQIRGFQPAWSDQASVETLFAELGTGIEQGFSPQDFDLAQLQELYAAAQSGSTEAHAAFDILATNSAIALVHHIFFGKVDPAALDADWNFSKPLIERDPAVVLNEYVNNGGFADLMDIVAIDNAQYTMLVTALGKYKAIKDAGGWPGVPDAEVLKPRMSNPAVAVLRQRLSLETGQGMPIGTDPTVLELYDDTLVKQVKAFQNRHGLNADGVIGGKTFLSLNQPVEDRINKIRLSLERGRWMMRDLEDRFVMVNIAGARTYFFNADGTFWTTRSITGSQYRKTPVFRDEIKYMEFNPTWTVPASIFKADKLPRIRKDPGYLDRNNYIVRNSSGETIPASSVNWNAQNPGVTLVQKPGPKNALGLVKFMFPNKYAVYLHDTDNRNLFDQNERNLSSGCVRLEYPFEFASLLMESDTSWSREKMQAILDSGKTTRVNLPNPMPVLLTYWTAWVEDGEVHFREDPYDRDSQVLKALDG